MVLFMKAQVRKIIEAKTPSSIFSEGNSHESCSIFPGCAEEEFLVCRKPRFISVWT